MSFCSIAVAMHRGGDKTGGGWFDPYGTTEDTYVEQARQTVRAFVEFISEYFGPGSSRDTGRGDASARSTVPEGAIGNVHD